MSDVNEGPESLEETVRIAIAAQKRNTWANVRVNVAEDSSDGHTCVLQPVTKVSVTDKDGNVMEVELPQILDVPIAFAGGGGTTQTHMIKAGDEGTATISSLAIDAWHQQGGTQGQIDKRTHALSDATFHPGGRSDPRKLDNVSTVSDQNRSDDGKHFTDLHPQNGITHQSENMVLTAVGDGSSTLHSQAGVQIWGKKLCGNCG